MSQDAQAPMQSPLPLEGAAIALGGLLSDPIERVRSAAANALASMGPLGQTLLTGALNSPRETTRAAALRGLGGAGVQLAQAAVLGALEDVAPAVRVAALDAAGSLKIGGDAVARVLAEDPDGDVRACAARVLSHLGPDGINEALIAALGDEAVRETALVCLNERGWTPSSDTGAAILAMAKRDWAQLIQLGAASVPLLARALREQSSDKESVLLRARVIETLGTIGSREAAEAVEPSLTDCGAPARAAATRVMGRLSGFASKECGGVLHRLLVDDVNVKVRVGAATGLGLLGYAAARGDLRARAEADSEIVVRFAAAQALAALGETGLLIDQLAAGDGMVRRDAAVTLGELKAVEAIDGLIVALGDSLATVRAAALEALAQIGWTPVGVKRDADDERYSRWMTRAEQMERTGVTELDQRKMLAMDMTAQDALVRQAALEALAMRKDAELGELATPLLDDPVRQVRRAAAQTLQQLDKVPTGGPSLALFHVAMADYTAAAMCGEDARGPLLRSLAEHPSNERANAARVLSMLGGADVIDALANALGDAEPFVVVNSILAMGIVDGEAAAPHLSPLLGHPHSTVRTAAGRTLGSAGEKGVVFLATGLDADSPIAREAAARALAGVGAAAEATAPRLEALLLGDSNAPVRDAAAEALGAIPGVHAALKQAVATDTSWRVRAEAAKALGRTKPDGAADVLVRVLGDSYKGVREAALKALEAVGWEPDGDVAEAMLRLAQDDWKGLVRVGLAAVSLLAQTVSEKGADKISVERRVRAVETLEAIGLEHPDPRVEAALAPCLNDGSGPVRAMAARACGRLSFTGLGNALLDMAEHDAFEHARVAAASGLARAGSKSMTPALKSLADHDDSPNVRLAASRALAGPAIGDIALLIHALAAPEDEVRREAAIELGKTGNAGAIEPLIGTLGDAVTAVRAAARNSLEQLGWTPVGIKGDADSPGYRRWLTVSEVGGAGEAVDQGRLLTAALGSASADVRIGALEALADRADAAVAGEVAPLLDDPDRFVRRQAGWTLRALDAVPTQGAAAASAQVALGEMQRAAETPKDALAPLLRALKEHDAADRCAVVQALAGIDDKAAITAVEAALADEAAHVRRAAVTSLATLLGDKACGPLEPLLADPEDDIRRHTARTLAEAGKTGVDVLKVALDDVRSAVRTAVVYAIGSLEEPGPKLITAVGKRARKDDSAEVRALALSVLADAIGPDALDTVAQRLREDESFVVRRAAAEAVGRLKPKNAAELLIPALGDGYSEVRNAALQALSQTGWEPDDSVTKAVLALAAEDWKTLLEVGEPAAPLIAQALQEKTADIDGQKKRAEAVSTLARIGGQVAKEAIMDAFTDPSARVRAEAARATAALGMKEAGPTLLKALETDGDFRVRAKAAAAIGGLGLAAFAPQLSFAASQDDDAMVRTAAAIALAGPGIGDVERLIAQLGDGDMEVRRAAALELGRLKAKKALDPLIAVLSDAYAEVRTAAKSALFDVDWEPFGLRRTADAKGYDRWVLRQELSPQSIDQSQLEVLAGAVNHPDRMMRHALIETFILLGDPAAKKPLTVLSKDPDESVAAAAKSALTQLG